MLASFNRVRTAPALPPMFKKVTTNVKQWFHYSIIVKPYLILSSNAEALAVQEVRSALAHYQPILPAGPSQLTAVSAW